MTHQGEKKSAQPRNPSIQILGSMSTRSSRKNPHYPLPLPFQPSPPGKEAGGARLQCVPLPYKAEQKDCE